MNGSIQLANESARKVFLLMFFAECLLVFFYWIDILSASPSPVLHALVDLDGEGNLPAWFSSFQLALISLSLWSWVLKHQKGEKPRQWFLMILASAFLLWSADETAMLHERATALIGSRYVDWLPEYLLNHKLFIFAIAAILFIALKILWNDLAALWRWHRHESVIALFGVAICFLGGAILETLGYKYFANGVSPFLYQTEVCFEEFFEMLGASFLLYASVSLATQKASRQATEKSQRLMQSLNF
ncbi:MAG: hypothetical protein AB1757_07910 [Acidobacteriota bacterium]